MTHEEFSDEFDLLLNSYIKQLKFKDPQSIISIDLDEYEKSVCLTQAQEELVKEYFTGKNPFLKGFENTEEIRRYLTAIVSSHSTKDKVTGVSTLSTVSQIFNIPSEAWFIVYESAKLVDVKLGNKSGQIVIVKPVPHDSFLTTQKNPFKRANTNRVLRVDFTALYEGALNVVELISDYNIDTYFIRYVRQPQPIILTDLQDLSINGVSTITECELNPVLHRDILQRAVEIALSRYNKTGN